MSQYQVIVGNVGTVYDGDDKQKACDDYLEYVHISKYGTGRAAGETVTMMVDDEPENEFIGLVDRKPPSVSDPCKKVQDLMAELQSRLYFDSVELPTDFYGSKEYTVLVASLQPARDKFVGLI